MGIMYKQLTREILKNRVFVCLLLVLSSFTSFMYFFVQFSIDGNKDALKALPALSDNETLYMNALNSNSILALNFLIVLAALTGFVFGMFYYRFFRKNKKQIGCLKSLGFKDRALSFYFVIFTAVLSLTGAVLGLIGGYFCSSVLINANTRSYSVHGLIKGINVIHLAIGLLTAAVVSCLVALISYSLIRGKEVGVLLSGTNNKANYSGVLRFTSKLVKVLPIKNKFPLRIALRKPVAVIMMILAVMVFTVMFVMGTSLNLSSGKVFRSQTEGHDYLYDTKFDEYREQRNLSNETQTYLSVSGTLLKINGNKSVKQNIVGLETGKALLSLANSNETQLSLPLGDNVYINPALREMYGFQKGDTINLIINGAEHKMKVADIAANATSGCVYVDKNTLAKLLNLTTNAYNGALSIEPLNDGGLVTTHQQKIDVLNRASVSNQNSAVINQVIGCLVGCILIFLALLLNFQDSTRDILILHLIGYRTKAIKRMLIDIYKPIIWFSFLLTLLPSILIAQGVQKSLSIQTGDYMPFGTNVIVILIAFILLNVIYLLVQETFNFGIKHIVLKEEITEYTNAE